MGNKQTKPTGYRDYVTVRDASKALGVSIDTVRRWDRAGKLPSARLDGKNRYFSVQDLEAFKATQPLSTSEVAKLLKVSPSTVRRMEQSGQLQTVRGDNGHRGFQRQQVDSLTSAKAVKIPVSQASVKPATHTASAPIAVAVAAGHSAATHRLNRAKHKTRRAFLYGAAAAFSVMAILFFSFMVAPSQTNRALSFSSTSNKDNIDDWENASMWERMLKPFSDGALYAVKVVSPSTYKEVINPQTVSKGDSDTVDGREPGSNAGNLAILPVSGSELVDKSVTTSKLADGSIELENLSTDVIAVLNKTGATGPQGPEGPAGPSGGSSGGITGVLSGAGLTGGGTSGDLTLSVLFGASAGTAANGSNTFICSSGSGNLTGGGTTVTIGTTGTTCANIITNSAVSFATSTASPLFTNAGNLTISATGAGNDITLTSADKIILSGFDCSGLANGGVLTTNASGEISCENDDGGTGGVAGSGTTNRLALFSGASTVGDSWLIQNSSTLQLDNTRNLELLGGTVTATTFIGAVTGNASTASALAANPTDCSANQFAISIAASGNLSCAALSDADIPNTITIDSATTASTATAFVSNPTDCSANQFATTIAANGNLTCASITDADVADTLTASILVGSGSTTNAVDLATAEVAGNLPASRLQSAAADLGAANVTVDFSNTNGAFNTNITTDGNITASSFIGAITGNADTATALAANPTDCSANQFANAIAASGNLTCANLVDGDVPNNITIDLATLATSATALQSNPSDCSANQFATTIAANGNLSCAALTDGDIPDGITITLASTATALAANPTDCSANQFAISIIANGNLTCAALTDADVPNTITVDNATNASTATALASNPTDCSASQFATTIAANGNLSCASLTDGDIPNSITVDLATAATSLQSNPTDCAANQFANAIAASGNLTCSDVTLGTQSSGDYVASFTAGDGLTGSASGEGSTPTLAVASANGGIVANADNIALTVQTSGNALSSTTSSGSGLEILAGGLSLLQGCADSELLKWNETTDVWACSADAAGGVTDTDKGDITVSGSGANWNIDADSVALGTDTTGNYVSTLTAGNGISGASSTEGGTPTIALGNLTADWVQSGSFNISTAGDITATTFIGALTGNASTATALASNPSDCAANQFATTIAANGNLTCASLTDGDIPDGITITLAATATALAANPTDCSANQFANAIAASGNLTCANLVDADVPNSITIDLATTATALASNPTDCSANQFAVSIVASGNLSCAALTDADIPNTITVDVATTASTASALVSNPSDCSANQFATTIAANGNLTCATITDADVADTLTASILVGSGSTTNAVDLATAEVAGNLPASRLQSAAADLGAANVTVDFSNTNGAFNTNITTDGSITAGSFIGALTGNSSTATALAANPSDCAANQFATTIAASGNLTCAALIDGDVPNTITIDLASTATALAANPSDCSANQFATTIAANGNLSCAALTDGDIPNTITIDTATTASALATNPTDCSANQFATTIAASGNLTCASITDADVADTLTASLFVGSGSSTTAIDLATAEIAGNLRASNLQSAATDLGAANVTIDLSNTNGAFNTNLTLDGTVTAASFVGAITGNADTATALAANPSDCSANQFANAIATNGNLTCAAITDGDIPNSITIDLASTATALASNPSDCSANQFAISIVASGNLTCAGLTDGDIPNTITIDLATSATALAANPSDCSANQFAIGIIASGDLSCAGITDADVSDTLTASLFVGSGSTTTAIDLATAEVAGLLADGNVSDTLTSSIFIGSGSSTNAIDLATAEVAGNLLAGNLQSAPADLGAANVTVDFSNTNGAFNTNITTDGSITASSLVGALTGNASTASALAANPTDCSANQFANAIAASGNLTCAALTDGDIPNSITIDLASTATALASNPTDCGANAFATTIAANGNLTCASLTASNLPSSAADLGAANVTIDLGNTNGSFVTNLTTDGTITAATFSGALTGNASTATALAANPSDCSANQFANAIVASGNLTCVALVDADVPDGITVSLAATATALAANPADCSAGQFANTIAASGALTCAAILASNLPVAAADLGAADVNLNFGNTNGSFVTNLTVDGTIGTASVTTFTGAGATFSVAVAADGGITFNNSTDTLGAFTLAGTVDASTNILTNIGNAGTDFVAATGALTLAGVLTGNGGVTLGANQDLTATAGTGSILLNSTVSNASDDVILITSSFTGGGTDLLTYNGISLAAFSPTNAAGTDTVNGIKLGNMTDPGATITSTAVDIGTGWDVDLELNDASVNIKLAATDNTAVVSITDSAATPNTLVRIQDHSTNFGASVEAGAFINYNSMYADEFFKDRAQVAAAGNQNWGDNTEWSTGETGTCTWNGTADAINGITAILANAAASSCTLSLNDLGAATPNTWLDADNLPTLVMKVRPSVAGAGVPDTDHQFFAGMTDTTSATPASGAPTNGIYFSNASDTAGVTGTANWYAVTDNGGASTNTACSVAVSETAYALLIIKVISTSLVEFYIDGDVSNGISLTECGTGNTANINTAGMTAFLKADWDANASASTLDIDYYRAWQDDAAVQEPTADELLADITSANQETDTVTSEGEETTTEQNGTDVTSFTNIEASTVTVTLDMFANGSLTVAGPAVFNGTALFNQLVTFKDSTIFDLNVDVSGILTLNNNAGGYAVIKTGQQSVHVSFSQPYSQLPIIGVSLGGGKFASYSYNNVTVNGFDITLNTPSTEDLQFSWTASSIHSPITFAQE